MFRIVQADIFSVPYHLKGYKLSYGTITGVVAVIIKLIDEDGHAGWGEANPLQSFTEENAEDIADILEKKLLPDVLNAQNHEPLAIDALLDTFQPGHHLLAKGSVSMAFADITGKRRGISVAELLGGSIRKSLQVSYGLNNGSFDDDVAVIDERMDEGYVDYMLKMGTSPIADEISRVAALEKRYGDRVRFKADSNAGWSRADAREFLNGVRHSQLAFVEQPVAKDDLDGMADLARGTRLLISADESLTGMERAKDIIRKGAATVFSIKSSKNGGPLRAKAISELAREHGIGCYFNSMLEGGITQAASLHHAVSTHNILEIGHAFRSVLRLDGDVTNFASFVRNGMVHLPEGPGLGIEVDEERVHRTALTSRRVRCA